MPVQKLQPTFNLEQDRIEVLKQLIPEAVSDGNIDWDVLKEALGEHLEDEGADVEHFGLSWAGKREARRLASIPSKATLVPVLGEGIDEDTTGNIFIEGDNLEVLKLLQKSYAGRVKLIYIDPPYNTGNDFIYKDDFREPTEEYLKKTGQVDEEGKLLTSNPKSGGRFHSNWLNMMYPRLRLARNLLKDDGVIFISIDDNEVHNLRQLMNEIFGEECFINLITVKAKPIAGASGGGEDKRLKKNIEFILVYIKNNDEIGFNRFNDVYEENDLFELIEEMEEAEKSWKYTRVLLDFGDIEFFDQIKDGSGEPIDIYIHKNVRMKPISVLSREEGITEEQCYVKYFDRIFRDTNAQSSIRTRVLDSVSGHGEFFSIKYIPKSGRHKGLKTTLYYKGNNCDLIAWLRDVAVKKGDQLIKQERVGTFWSGFNWNNVSKEGGIIFPNGKKPILFIQRMIELSTDSEKEDIVLDFFSGSGSTAHAVLESNKQDGGNRKFIMVQIPEKVNNKEFSSIAEIGKERIRRVITKFKDEQSEKLDLMGGHPQDLGFKVYKLDRSNLKIWKDYEGKDIPEFEQLSLNFQNPLGESFLEEKVVTEIQLLEGFPLDSKIEQADTFTQNKVLCVTSEHIGHCLFICLDNKLDIATVQDVRLLEDEDIFICLDNALTDQEKMMLADGCNVKTI